MERAGLRAPLWDQGNAGCHQQVVKHGLHGLSEHLSLQGQNQTFKMSDPIMPVHHSNYLMPSDMFPTLWYFYIYNYMPYVAKVEVK